MPRAKEFDRDVVLEKAMHLFWENGYGSTSVQDLVECMGINRFSLYAAFGSKRALFFESLQRYEERDDLVFDRMENSDEGLASIRAYFDALLRYLASPAGKNSCLMINTISEMAATDEEVGDCTGASVARLECAFARALRRAMALGEIDDSRSAEALAEYLATNELGLHVLARLSPPAARLRVNVETILAVL